MIGWSLQCAEASGWLRATENVGERLWPTHAHTHTYIDRVLTGPPPRRRKTGQSSFWLMGTPLCLSSPSPPPWLLSISFHPFGITLTSALSLSFPPFPLNFIYRHPSILSNQQAKDAAASPPPQFTYDYREQHTTCRIIPLAQILHMKAVCTNLQWFMDEWRRFPI